jgi:hypothetical protein
MALLRDDPAGGAGARIIGGLLSVNDDALPQGFVPVQFVAVNFTAATSEALLSLTPQRDFAAGTPGTSMTVTPGKRLRIAAIAVAMRNAAAAVQGIECRLRISVSGAVTVASPLVAVVAAGTSAATANVAGFAGDDFDTIDLPASAQIGVSQLGTATAGNTLVVRGYEYTP